MANDNETVADIIAEKRRLADKIESSTYKPYSFQRERIAELRREADRLEAAHRRELEAAHRRELEAARREPRTWGECVAEYQKRKEAGEYGPY